MRRIVHPENNPGAWCDWQMGIIIAGVADSNSTHHIQYFECHLTQSQQVPRGHKHTSKLNTCSSSASHYSTIGSWSTGAEIFHHEHFHLYRTVIQFPILRKTFSFMLPSHPTDSPAWWLHPSDGPAVHRWRGRGRPRGRRRGRSQVSGHFGLHHVAGRKCRPHRIRFHVVSEKVG